MVFGAVLTRSRPILRWLHIGSLIWGILTELMPWPCPLTLLENWLEQKAGVEPYQGSFLLHYIDKLVYPDISATLLTVAGVLVCALNLAIWYASLESSPSQPTTDLSLVARILVVEVALEKPFFSRDH